MVAPHLSFMRIWLVWDALDYPWLTAVRRHALGDLWGRAPSWHAGTLGTDPHPHLFKAGHMAQREAGETGVVPPPPSAAATPRMSRSAAAALVRRFSISPSPLTRGRAGRRPPTPSGTLSSTKSNSMTSPSPFLNTPVSARLLKKTGFVR